MASRCILHQQINNNSYRMIALHLFCLFIALSLQQILVPTDGMVIRSSCTLQPGTYALPKGITISCSNCQIQASGVSLVGAFNSNSTFPAVGVSIFKTFAVTLSGISASGYYYGLMANGASQLTVKQCVFDNNWNDPSARTPNAPWLDIFVSSTSYGDKTNLGGGIFLNTVDNSVITQSSANNNNNGIDAYKLTNTEISFNSFSNESGWGVHLYQSTSNRILNNHANNCNRPHDGDSAGLLLSCSSQFNTIKNNEFRFGGDGVYLAWTPPNQGIRPQCCDNSFNNLDNNDCSFASANCIEADFGVGNVFTRNIAQGARFGFWLGYSRNSIVANNKILNNTWNGIAIEHGQNNVIDSNLITNNGNGGPQPTNYAPPWQKNAILLWSDLNDDYPEQNFTCLKGYDHKPSRNYTITNNRFENNGVGGSELSNAISLQNTTDSLIFNNYFSNGSVVRDVFTVSGTISTHQGVAFSLHSLQQKQNIIGGSFVGGNYYADYAGCDNNGDGIGDTPYDGTGTFDPADQFPLTNTHC